MQFLGELVQIIQPVLGVGLEEDQAGAAGIAAIDIAAAVAVGGLVAGDRGQHHPRQAVGHVQAGTDAVIFLRIVVAAVKEHRAGNIVCVQLVAALGQDIGAEDGGGAVQRTAMHVQKCAEIVVGLPQKLGAAGPLVIAAQCALLAGEGVVDPVVAVLVEAGDAERQRVGDAIAEGALDIGGVILAERGADIAVLLPGGAGAGELDHAGGGVAAEQGALGSAIDFDIDQVIQRRAFQHHILHHHIVHDDRDGLRGGQVEIGIAEAADVETRRRAAVGGFGIEAGNMGGDCLDVLARLEDHREIVTRQCRGGDRHVLLVFRVALGGDHHGFDLVVGEGRPRGHQAQQRDATQQRGGALFHRVGAHFRLVPRAAPRARRNAVRVLPCGFPGPHSGRRLWRLPLVMAGNLSE